MTSYLLFYLLYSCVVGWFVGCHCYCHCHWPLDPCYPSIYLPCYPSPVREKTALTGRLPRPVTTVPSETEGGRRVATVEPPPRKSCKSIHPLALRMPIPVQANKVTTEDIQLHPHNYTPTYTRTYTPTTTPTTTSLQQTPNPNPLTLTLTTS